MVVVPYFLLKHHGKTPCSTIFQGKVNPTQCEALTMVCAQVPYLILWKRILLFALSSWWRAIAYLKNNYSSHIYIFKILRCYGVFFMFCTLLGCLDRNLARDKWFSFSLGTLVNLSHLFVYEMPASNSCVSTNECY